MSHNKFVIRVYGDSYSMPRSFIGVPFDQTYSELISEKIGSNEKNSASVYLYNRSQGGADINQLYQTFLMDSTYFGKRPEDILIIQSGIVDCAPHPIPFWLKKQIAKLPGILLRPVVKFLHKNRPVMLKMGLSWKRTSKRKFFSVYKKWMKHASDFRRVYIFNIMSIRDELDAHSPGFKKSIREYNRLIYDAVNSVQLPNICLIDVFNIVNERKYLSEDGYHLSLEGHRLFSKLLLKRLK